MKRIFKVYTISNARLIASGFNGALGIPPIGGIPPNPNIPPIPGKDPVPVIPGIVPEVVAVVAGGIVSVPVFFSSGFAGEPINISKITIY